MFNTFILSNTICLIFEWSINFRFSSGAEVIFNLKDHETENEVLNAISSIQHTGGGTDIAAALHKAKTDVILNTAVNRADARDIIILSTDGQDTSNRDSVNTEAAELRKLGVGRCQN